MNELKASSVLEEAFFLITLKKIVFTSFLK